MALATLRTAAACLVCIGLGACGDDDPTENASSGTVDVELSGRVLGEPFALEPVTYSATEVAEGFRFTRVSMFISDVRLDQVAEGQSLGTDVAEVAYLQLGTAGDVASLSLANVPHGRYTALKFRLGLTAEQDASTPADYPSGHPLARSGEYWRDWGSYIYLKLEGKSDTLADGVERFDAPFVYHVGRSGENAREITLPIDLTVDEGNPVLRLDLDAGRLLGLDRADPLSLKGVTDHCNDAAARIMDNAQRAFALAD